MIHFGPVAHLTVESKYRVRYTVRQNTFVEIDHEHSVQGIANTVSEVKTTEQQQVMA